MGVSRSLQESEALPNERPSSSAEQRADLLSGVAREWTATFDAIEDFVSVHDSGFRIVRANRALAKLVGFEPKELLGRKCHEIFHGTGAPPPNCPHARALETSRAVTEEVLDLQLGVPLLITCSPFHDSSGALVGTVHVARDISKQKQAEEERERLIAELQQSLATVRTLSGLLPICSSCKKIRDGAGGWVPIEHYISKHSEADFTHGICPECFPKYFPADRR